MTLRKKRLGQLQVPALGLGCMSMSEFYGEPPSAEKCIATIQGAIDHGLTFLDTADMYGMGHNEQLLGRAIQGRRDTCILATKFGILRKQEEPEFRALCAKPAYIKQQCELSLKRLGVDTIDLYYLHRVDPETPIEESVFTMSQLVQEGKVRYLGLSEAPGELIRKAHAVHPISALQSEYSLWWREPEESILALCQELDIGFVAYSPLGRGFLSGAFRKESDLAPGDFRKTMPKFQDDNLPHNLKIIECLEAIAQEKGCTSPQLALAWMMHQSPQVVPLFGTTRLENALSNLKALDISLSQKQLQAINDRVPLGFAKGARYSPATTQLYKILSKR